MSNVRSRPYFVGALITSVVGAIMLLAADFAGWEYEAAYGDQTLYRAGSIGLIGPYFVVIAAFAGLLFYAAFVSYQHMRSGDAPVGLQRLQLAFFAAVLASLASFIAGILFLVVIAIKDPGDWWLDLGFYGGVIGGALAAIFLRLALKASHN